MVENYKNQFGVDDNCEEEFSSVLNIMFVSHIEESDKFISPVLIEYLKSSEESKNITALTLISEFENSSNIELLNTLLDIWKSKLIKRQNSLIFVCLSNFFSLMMKENMNEEIIYVYKNCFLKYTQMSYDEIESDFGEVSEVATQIGLAIVIQLFDSANKFKFKLNVDINQLCKIIYEKMESDSENIQVYVQILTEVFHENTKIDSTNEFVIKLFEKMIEGAEKDENLRFEYFNALQFFVYQLKYVTKNWLSKMMKLCISILKEYFTNDEIDYYELNIILVLILIIIQTFEEDIESCISTTNFFEMIKNLSNMVCKENEKFKFFFWIRKMMKFDTLLHQF